MRQKVQLNIINVVMKQTWWGRVHIVDGKLFEIETHIVE